MRKDEVKYSPILSIDEIKRIKNSLKKIGLLFHNEIALYIYNMSNKDIEATLKNIKKLKNNVDKRRFNRDMNRDKIYTWKESINSICFGIDFISIDDFLIEQFASNAFENWEENIPENLEPLFLIKQIIILLEEMYNVLNYIKINGTVRPLEVWGLDMSLFFYSKRANIPFDHRDKIIVQLNKFDEKKLKYQKEI